MRHALFFAAVIVLTTVSAALRAAEPLPQKPNIILLLTDDQRDGSLGALGHPWVKTPNLDRLVRDGVRFCNTYIAEPTCSPSRAALLTGQYPHQCGMTALAHKGGRLTDPSHHLAAFLKSQGYATALSGVQHVTPKHNPEGIRELGYDRALSQ